MLAKQTGKSPFFFCVIILVAAPQEEILFLWNLIP